MSTIEVYRRVPPDVQRCAGKGCGQLVEWVLAAVSGRRMPVTHRLIVIATREREDGLAPVTVIDGATVHFSTCPAADTFRKRPARARKAKAPQQADLFRDGADQ